MCNVYFFHMNQLWIWNCFLFCMILDIKEDKAVKGAENEEDEDNLLDMMDSLQDSWKY